MVNGNGFEKSALPGTVVAGEDSPASERSVIARQIDWQPPHH
jgi:hypothetical protein